MRPKRAALAMVVFYSASSPPRWDSEEQSRELEVQFAPPFELQLIRVGSNGRVGSYTFNSWLLCLCSAAPENIRSITLPTLTGLQSGVPPSVVARC